MFKTIQRIIFEGREGRFIHGTLRSNIGKIKRDGIEPKVGKYTRQAYRGYGGLKPAVFLAKDGDEDDTHKAYASIIGQIGRKLKKHPAHVTPDDIEKHGALAVARPDKYDTYHMHPDGYVKNLKGGYGDENNRPEQAEPDDYYSEVPVHPTGIMKGKRLVRYLKNRGHIK